jgi:hypothetical protein
MNVVYKHHIATFMETLTGKEPGDWFPAFETACKQASPPMDPQAVLDAIDDVRINNPEHINARRLFGKDSQ